MSFRRADKIQKLVYRSLGTIPPDAHVIGMVRLSMIIERYFATYGLFTAVGLAHSTVAAFHSYTKFLVLPTYIGFQKTGKFKPGIETHHA